MLSLVGSIQNDPFSPGHVPETGTSKTTVSTQSDDDLPSRPLDAGAIENGVDDDSENDTFQQLGKMADEAAAAEAKRKASIAEFNRKEKKRKRKSTGAVEGNEKAKRKKP